MPKIRLVPFSKNKFSLFAPEVLEKIKEIIKNKEKAIFFINRKALATTILCQDCGYIFKCPTCDIPLILHQIKKERKIICHHCGLNQRAPEICLNCQSHKLKSLGIGTERVALEIKKFYPDLKFQLLYSEKKDLIPIIKDFNENKYQFLIATEVLFKPQIQKVSYIIVVSIDNLLFLPDYRSEEKTFLVLKDLLKLSEKELIIQTINPSNKLFLYFKNNLDKIFFQEELKWRKTHQLPPFWQIVKISYKHPSFQQALEEIEKGKQLIEKRIKLLKRNDKFLISNPVPAFIFKEKGYYCFHLFLKMKYDQDILNLSFTKGLDSLTPFPLKEELKLRNLILKDLDQKFIIEVDPISIL